MKQESPIIGTALSNLQTFENTLNEIFKIIDSENPNAAWMKWPKPIARIGTYAKGVVRADDKEQAIQFVCICERHPTRELVQGVVEKVRQRLDPRESEVAVLKQFPSYFTVSYGRKGNVLPVYFTSSRLFNQVEVIPKYYGTPLSRESCIKLLMEIKRKEFYLKEMKRMPGYTDILRILRDVASRSKAWAELSGWPLEVIVRNALGGSINLSAWPTRNGLSCYEGIPMQPQPMNKHAMLKRVFEYVASGSLYLYGLLDPVKVVNIERQVLKKLVGYDEDDVITLEAGPEMPTQNEQVRELLDQGKTPQVDSEPPKKVPKLISEDKKWSDNEDEPNPDEANAPTAEILKPRARKRERKSKFGKKAEEYQVAPISTAKIVKKGDVAVETEEKAEENETTLADADPDDRMAQALAISAKSRPKLMKFIKAGETKVTSGLENLEKDETVNDVVELTPEELEKQKEEKELASRGGVSKETFQSISQPLNAQPENTNDMKGSDGLKASGLHIDLVSSLRPQHIENITASAHTILRMLNFNWTHKVLGVSANVITAMELEELRVKEEMKRKKLAQVKMSSFKHYDFSRDQK